MKLCCLVNPYPQFNLCRDCFDKKYPGLIAYIGDSVREDKKARVGTLLKSVIAFNRDYPASSFAKMRQALEDSIIKGFSRSGETEDALVSRASVRKDV